MNPLIPRLSDYDGPWSVHIPTFMGNYSYFESLDLSAHMQNVAASGKFDPMAVETQNFMTSNGSVRVIEINGTMMKTASSLAESTSTVAVKKEIRNAVNDPSVAAILLKISSPGGTVAGTKELADAISSAARVKPVHVFGEDMVASAAVWASMGADHISVNPTALFGSIGTLLVVTDTSAAFEQRGVKVHVISTGPFKGAGTPGAPISQEQLDKFQSLVTSLNGHFVNAVQAGRSLSGDQVQQVATGELFSADQAKSLGLVDSIGTFEDALDRLGVPNMNPATAAEIRSAIPAADEAFISQMVTSRATLSTAQAVWASRHPTPVTPPAAPQQVPAVTATPAAPAAPAPPAPPAVPVAAPTTPQGQPLQYPQPQTAPVVQSPQPAASLPPQVVQQPPAAPQPQYTYPTYQAPAVVAQPPASYHPPQVVQQPPAAPQPQNMWHPMAAPLRMQQYQPQPRFDPRHGPANWQQPQQVPQANAYLPPGYDPYAEFPGVDPGSFDPLPYGPQQPASFQDPVGEFDMKVRQKMALNPSMSRKEAIQLSVREDPNLHAQFVKATNHPSKADYVDQILNRPDASSYGWQRRQSFPYGRV